MKFNIRLFFRNSLKEIIVSLHLTRITKTNINFLSYLTQLFLEREYFQTNFERKSKHKFYVQQLSPKIVPFVRFYFSPPSILQFVRGHSAVVLTVTINGMQEIHPVIYLLLSSITID
jgi:hypothetical protein